jgi:hypothetical protein
MENISLVKKIEAYLKKELSPAEMKDFEHEVSIDPELDKLVEHYRFTLGALKREWLNIEILAAARALYWMRILRTIGFSVLGIVSLSVFWLNNNPGKKEAKAEDHTPLVSTAIVESPAEDTTSKTEAIVAACLPENVSMQNKKVQEIICTEAQIEPASEVIPERYPGSEELLCGFRNSLTTDTQTFTISNFTDTLLHGVAGVTIHIPARSLLNYSTGQEVSANVNIRLCEFTGYSAMYNAKVSTLCKDKLLVSGGSCFLAAYENGDSVILKKDSAISIGFDCKVNDPEMTTFYGKRDSAGTVTWTQQKNIRPFVSRPRFIIPIRMKERSWQKDLWSSSRFGGTYGFNKNSRQLYDTLYFKKTYESVSATTNRRIYSHLYEQKFGNPLKWKSQTFFSDVKSHKDLGEYVLLPVEQPLQTPNIMGCEKGKAAMNIIRSGQFGFINCDHFSYRNNLQDVVLSSKDTLLDSYMFFLTERSCLPAYYGRFNNIPANSEVVIVSLFNKNHRLYMSIQKTRTSPKVQIEASEPLDPAKLKAALDDISRGIYPGA